MIRWRVEYILGTIKWKVAFAAERLWAVWSKGRPEGWTADKRTRETVVIGLWLREELSAYHHTLSEDDMKLLEQVFHRRSRSEEDLYQIANEVLEAAANNEIDRERQPHRRWG